MSEEKEDAGENEVRENGCPLQQAEEETEEASEMEGKREQVVGESEKKVEDAIDVCEREQTGHIRSRRPRSFLYSHHQSVSGQPTTSSSSTSSSASQTSTILTRRKLRGERVRPHSMYVERSRIVEEQSSGTVPVSHARSLGFSRVKASLVRGQERLRQAVSPSRSNREQAWMSREQANILAPADGLRGQQGSPETRRRRRDWRRHTVLVNMPAEG